MNKHTSKGQSNRLSSWSNFPTKTLTSQKIPCQLPHPTQQQINYEQSSSLLSLSNYLQQQDSSLYFSQKQTHKSHKSDPILVKESISKRDMFKEIQSAQQIFMKHLGTEVFNFDFDKNDDEPSESMLLIDSEIRENDEEAVECVREVNRKHTNRNDRKNQTSIKEIINYHSGQFQELEELPSRIEPSSTKSHPGCSQSVELLELLAIPKDSARNSRLQDSIKQNDDFDDHHEFRKLKQMYEMFQSNKHLLKKMHLMENNEQSIEQTTLQVKKPKQQQNHKSIQPKTCHKCLHLQQTLKTIQTQLQSKQKQIKKYEQLIQKLNSTHFDLKIENKRLTFENNQYAKQLQKLLGQRNEIKTHQRVRTLGYDDVDERHRQQQDDSFYYDNDESEENVTNSGLAGFSRKTADNFFSYESHQNLNKFQDAINEQKIYPQTPLPTSSYVNNKYKKHRKPSNHSEKRQVYDQNDDNYLEISISQVRQPTVFQVAENTTQNNENILKEHNYEIAEQRAKSSHRGDRNVMKFSQLTNKDSAVNSNANYIQNNRKTECFDARKFSPLRCHQPLSQKSPSKMHSFLKVKDKRFSQQQQNQSIQNLKAHPLNQIMSQQDSISDASQTKTQKLYGLKRASSQEYICLEQNDYNMLNINKLNIEHQHYYKMLNKQHLPPRPHKSPHQNSDKNSFVYKSFKEVGSLYENSPINVKEVENLQQNFQNENLNNAQYQTFSQKMQDKNVYGVLRSRQKSQRGSLSPSPSALGSKRQGCGRITEINSPCKKRSSQQTAQTKASLR